MDRERKEKSAPYPETQSAEPYFGQPEDCAELVNRYGTYNIQPTADTGNTFPLISHALPERWRNLAIGREELERTERE